MSAFKSQLCTASAREAGLHYVSDGQPGIKRIGNGKNFTYLNPRGRTLKNVKTLARIKGLVIPPAWTEVWICRDPKGHIQAVGRDARGRKQYRYHSDWRAIRDENKFDRMLAFGKALPRIRREVHKQIRQPALTREKVLAAVLRLLEISAARVGNEEYAATNQSYGLTTLRNRHAKVTGSTIELRFRGKSGQEQQLTIEHPALARIVRKCQHLPGQKLFQYVTEEGPHDVSSGDVNAYLAEITGQDFTAKDFRTWAGTVTAMSVLNKLGPVHSKNARKRNLAEMIRTVAEHLGNTPAICKKCYIHPTVMENYLRGMWVTGPNSPGLKHSSRNKLRPEEMAVLRLLKSKPLSGS